MTMTKRDSGRLGAAKAKLTKLKQKQERVDTYNASPNSCKECGRNLSYEKRHSSFCGYTCSNRGPRVAEDSRWSQCKTCDGKVFFKRTYCSAACQQEDRYEAEIKPKILRGEVSEPSTLKRFLKRERGDNCAICTINTWNGLPLVLQLDHVDGDATNNQPANLRLLCPNCHSQTPTYTGKNRGNGRKSRRKQE